MSRRSSVACWRISEMSRPGNGATHDRHGDLRCVARRGARSAGVPVGRSCARCPSRVGGRQGAVVAPASPGGVVRSPRRDARGRVSGGPRCPGGSSSAGQSSGLIIRQVVGSSPTCPTDTPRSGPRPGPSTVATVPRRPGQLRRRRPPWAHGPRHDPIAASVAPGRDGADRRAARLRLGAGHRRPLESSGVDRRRPRDGRSDLRRCRRGPPATPGTDERQRGRRTPHEA